MIFRGVAAHVHKDPMSMGHPGMTFAPEHRVHGNDSGNVLCEEGSAKREQMSAGVPA